MRQVCACVVLKAGDADDQVDEVLWMVPVNLKPFSEELPEDLGNHFALVMLDMPLTGATSTVNYAVTATAATTASQSVNALRLSPAAATTLTIGTGFTQTIVSGGILANGTFAGTITGGTLTAGVLNTANTLFVHQYNTALLTISSVIANNGTGALTLVKAGPGALNKKHSTHTRGVEDL